MKSTHVGRVELGIDGHDIYTHVDLAEDDIENAAAAGLTPLEHLKAIALERSSFDRGTGQLFCDSVTVLPFPHSETRFVVITQVRRDI